MRIEFEGAYVELKRAKYYPAFASFQCYFDSTKLKKILGVTIFISKLHVPPEKPVAATVYRLLNMLQGFVRGRYKTLALVAHRQDLERFKHYGFKQYRNSLLMYMDVIDEL